MNAECENEFPCSKITKQANSTVRTYDVGFDAPHGGASGRIQMCSESCHDLYSPHVLLEAYEIRRKMLFVCAIGQQF